jgi:hypothetical protein
MLSALSNTWRTGFEAPALGSRSLVVPLAENVGFRVRFLRHYFEAQANHCFMVVVIHAGEVWVAS